MSLVSSRHFQEVALGISTATTRFALGKCLEKDIASWIDEAKRANKAARDEMEAFSDFFREHGPEGVLIARIWMKASHTYDEKIEQARETILLWNEQAGAFSEELLQEDLRIPVMDLPMHLIELRNKLLDEVTSATHWSTHMNQLLKDLTR